MRRRLPRMIVRIALALAVLLGAVVAEGAVAPAPTIPTSGRTRPTFQVSGRIVGMVPGRPTTLRVTVANRYGFPIAVTRVDATVSSRVGTCPARSLTVRPWSGHRRVPAGSKRRVALKVVLRHGAPVECAGVRFQLRYAGRARRAAGR